MKLTCKECGSQILASGIDINSLMAKCGSCHSVFSFEDKFSIEKEDSRFDTESTKEVSLPGNIKINETGGTLRIEMRWFHWSKFIYVIFILAWSLLPIGLFSFAIAFELRILAVIASFPGAILAFFTYRVLAGIFNKTTITINHQNFIVKIGPFPWLGNKNLNTSDIIQLYVKSIRKTGNKNSIYFRHEVHAVLKNGTHLRILKSLEQSKLALYFEQKIEDFLQIEDEHIRGEIEK